jgi:hypothetical protein
MAVDAEVAIPQVVRVDEDDVGRGRILGEGTP